MDALTLFGVVSVAAMLVFYALEERSGWFVLALAFAAASGRRLSTGFCRARGLSG
jgi:hypothetical protein